MYLECSSFTSVSDNPADASADVVEKLQAWCNHYPDNVAITWHPMILSLVGKDYAAIIIATAKIESLNI